MAGRGAPKGNKNASKEKRWAGALRRALAEYEDETCRPGEALQKIAQNVVRDAVAGDWESIQEIACREDGKPAQSVDMNINDERTGRSELVAELAGLYARLAGRSDGRGAEPDSGSVPTGGKAH